MPDSNSTNSDQDHNVLHGHIYGYIPSEPAAAVFTILFLVISLLHTVQLFGSRTWFMIPFLFGVWFEAVGYGFRAYSATQDPNYSLLPFVLQLLLPLVAPTLIAATLYMELGRIIRLCKAEKLSIIRVTWLTKIFVLGDLLTIATQFIGGAIFANPNNSNDKIQFAKHLLTFGFVVQILFLVLYILTAYIFYMRYTRVEATGQHGASQQGATEHVPWRRHLFTLFFGISMILMRAIVRLIDYVAMPDSLKLHEWSVYVLDAVPMLLVALLFAFVHPSEINALLKHRGRIVRYFLRFSRPPAPATYMEMYNKQDQSQQHAQSYMPQQPAGYFTPAASNQAKAPLIHHSYGQY